MFGKFERRIDEDLEELSLRDESARHLAFARERGDERDYHNQASVENQSCYFSDAANVLDPVGVGEPEGPCAAAKGCPEIGD